VLKKTIEYRDLDGNKVSDDFYFHMNKAELVALEKSTPGGFRSYMATLNEETDQLKILQLYKDIISASIGQRHPDGRQFIKTPEFAASFMNTDAYSELILSFFSDGMVAAQFLAGVMPADLTEKIAPEVLRQTGVVITPGEMLTATEPEKPKTLEEYTQDELMTMDIEKFRGLVAESPGNNLPKHVILALMRRQGQ
jgi:hypothetical protein